LDHFQKNSDRYWLIVSDIMMPSIDGIQFIKRVKEVKPDVKVFFMSAFLTDDIQYRTGLSLLKVDEYLEKPISLNDFIKLVKKYFLMTETLRIETSYIVMYELRTIAYKHPQVQRLWNTTLSSVISYSLKYK